MDEGGGRLTTDEQKPYRMEYCEGCPVPECDFWDAECSREWVDKLLVQERERCAGRSLAAVDAVLEDLTDRQGLSGEWWRIEPEIQLEIMNAWKDAIAGVIMQEQAD